MGLEVFTGVMAIYGGVSLLIDASGFGVQEEWLRGSPFTSYQIPAIALLVFVAGGNLLSAALLWLRRQPGLLLSAAVGVGLMLFEIVEAHSFGLRTVQQPLMSAIGLVVATLVVWMWHEDRMGAVTRDGMTLAH
jgi:hypothetical protein